MTSTTAKSARALMSRLGRWITPRWALKTIGLYLLGAAVAAAVFIVAAASLTYPQATWIVVVIAFAAISLLIVMSDIEIQISSRGLKVRVRTLRHH
jgi:uncharacterized membrane protein